MKIETLLENGEIILKVDGEIVFVYQDKGKNYYKENGRLKARLKLLEIRHRIACDALKKIVGGTASVSQGIANKTLNEIEIESEDLSC